MQSRVVFHVEWLKVGGAALVFAACGGGAALPAEQTGAHSGTSSGGVAAAGSPAAGGRSQVTGSGGNPGPAAGASAGQNSAASGSTSYGGAPSGSESDSGGGNPGGGNPGGGNPGGSAGGSGGGSDAPLPPSVTSLFPKPGASGVCVDVPLTMTFATAPSIGSKGTIAIYSTQNPNTAVDQIDIAAASYSDTIGGQTKNLVRPVFIEGTSAVIYFRSHKLSANTSYFVSVSAGTFVDAQKKAIGTVSERAAWSFSTGAVPAASASMAVNRTGNGGFCTVQGAFDALPSNDSSARTITVASGNYYELLLLSNKKNLTLRGADRATTVIRYPNNENLNGGTSGRPLFFANGTSDLTIQNLTLYNTTPQGGGQAEALRVQAERVTVRDVNLKSLQDTLLTGGSVYVVNSYLEGNVDFVWGTGPTYFDRCEIKTVGRAGAIVQARNGAAGYGYVFVDSKITADATVTGQVLARIDATVYPASNVAFLNCQMSSAIAAKGWTITPTGTSATDQLRFWEYQSTDAQGALLDVAGRDRASKQLSASQAANLRDKATVLGGWNPQ
ncbi:MAG TPA: pectinesterase family protein [Polyangiaceae bacterium]|nr:pectinesterase family protein [Polyangiaceae bacterium]